MKQRVISSLIGLGVLVVVFFFLDTLLFNIVIGLIGVLAVLELLNAVKCTRFRALTALGVFIAAAIPFAQEHNVRVLMPAILFVLVLAFFIILLKDHEKLRVEQVAMVFLFSVFVPVFFSSAIYLRNSFGAGVGGLYLLWALGSAWLSDTGAYFTGRAFGKRKLAPLISPKKTVEGAIGGVVVATAAMVLVAYLYQSAMALWAYPITVNYLLLVLLTPVFSVIGILGDLSASVIKRQFDVKDYGNIMPGHGGIMDRFDSALFTLPAVFIAVQHIVVVAIK
ncbi:MAG: phosphatidate cytidylyltransferase [Oscillospiraceae bacterium]|jgi:phosphatidate cytidylyltransferase|nr:phosphatidate cytidylyltransferase [Oscillospiraceae bacterium]